MAPSALGLLDLGIPNPWTAYSQSIINRHVFGLNGEFLIAVLVLTQSGIYKFRCGKSISLMHRSIYEWHSAYKEI